MSDIFDKMVLDMEKIRQLTIREFSRYFSRYKRDTVDVTERGEVVGHYEPTVGRRTTEQVSDKEKVFGELKRELDVRGG